TQVVLLFGQSRWEHHQMLLDAVPPGVEVVSAENASSAIGTLRRFLPCDVILIVPPDVAEMLRLIDALRQQLRPLVTVVDPSGDERVERFARLAGCSEYHPAYCVTEPEWGCDEPPGDGLACERAEGGAR
ncbi:MAG: V-type ATP synthase subunit F, partial [Phycisphaerales bacterium]|nr:V-type ATP synthase subunit F [Phycisphaerales bacterium]